MAKQIKHACLCSIEIRRPSVEVLILRVCPVEISTLGHLNSTLACIISLQLLTNTYNVELILGMMS